MVLTYSSMQMHTVTTDAKSCHSHVDGSRPLYQQNVRRVTYTRAVWKVHGLALLLRVGTLWRCGDGLFFRSSSLGKRYTSYNAPPTSRKLCRPLITSKFLASELPFHGWKSPEIAWSEIWIEFCVRPGKSGSVEPHQNIRHTFQISPPCHFWAFPTMKRELRGKKFRSDQRSAAHFREVGGKL
jgi:hypothetical protein